MQIVIDIPDAPIKDYQDLFYKIHGMAASEGLFDDKVKSQRALALKVVLDILDGIVNGTPLPKGHGELKDFEKIYADMSEREELARQRVIDTPSNSPCYMRYVAQLNERTAFKEMLYDAPTIIEADKESEI